MTTTMDPPYDVTDLGLAAEGVRRIEWAEREMPVLRASLRALETHAATADARSRTQAETVAKLNGTVETLGKSLDALRDMNAKAEERGFARALANIRKQATAAAAEGDADGVSKAIDAAQDVGARHLGLAGELPAVWGLRTVAAKPSAETEHDHACCLRVNVTH